MKRSSIHELAALDEDFASSSDDEDADNTNSSYSSEVTESNDELDDFANRRRKPKAMV